LEQFLDDLERANHEKHKIELASFILLGIRTFVWNFMFYFFTKKNISTISVKIIL